MKFDDAIHAETKTADEAILASIIGEQIKKLKKEDSKTLRWSTNHCLVALTVAAAVMVLAMVAITIACALEIQHLKAEVASLENASPLQQALDAISERVNTTTLQVSKSDTAFQVQTLLLQEAISAFAEKLDNTTMQVATLGQVASIELATTAVSNRLDDLTGQLDQVLALQQQQGNKIRNITVQVATLDVTTLQQTLNTISGRLDQAATQSQLQRAISALTNRLNQAATQDQLQQAINALSDRLNQAATQDQVASLQEELNTLANRSMQVATLGHVTTLQKALNIVSDRLDNITMQDTLLDRVTTLEQVLNTSRHKLYDITEQVSTLGEKISLALEAQDNITKQALPAALVQQVFIKISDKLDNISVQVTQDSLEALDIVSNRLDNMSVQVTTRNKEISQALSNASGRLDDIITQVTSLHQTTSQAINTTSSKLESITAQVTQDYSNRIQQLATFSNLSFTKMKEDIHDLENLLSVGAGKRQGFPVHSCVALLPYSPSGYYWVRASDGSAVRVYCDMTRSCGGVTGGWMRVAQLDMTNTSHQCPSPLRESTQSSIRTCVRESPVYGCSSVFFSTANITFTKICGRIIAYQYGAPEAFHGGTISTRYVDGVSLTYGTPRQHIWTFAATKDEIDSSGPKSSCPCITASTHTSSARIPSFVGTDYFCDTASENRVENKFYSNDPLWDGAGCGRNNTCCSFNTPPWFYRQLPHTTTDDIEMRLCRDADSDNEDIAIEMIDLYIK